MEAPASLGLVYHDVPMHYSVLFLGVGAQARHQEHRVTAVPLALTSVDTSESVLPSLSPAR